MINLRRHRGLLKLKKGIVKNLHPELQILDDTAVPFEGWFDLDLRFFYINYGFSKYDKGILTPSVKSIVQVIKEYEAENTF